MKKMTMVKAVSRSHVHVVQPSLTRLPAGRRVRPDSPSSGTARSKEGSLNTVSKRETAVGAGETFINIHQVPCGHHMGIVRLSGIIGLGVTE